MAKPIDLFRIMRFITTSRALLVKRGLFWTACRPTFGLVGLALAYNRFAPPFSKAKVG